MAGEMFDVEGADMVPGIIIDIDCNCVVWWWMVGWMER